jgi:hypothetical protein
LFSIPRLLFMGRALRSVSDLDPDWIRIKSGYSRAKITHKNRKSKEISCFEVLDVLF